MQNDAEVFKKIVKEQADLISNIDLYYTLKSMKVRHISKMLEEIKYAVALYGLNLPINTKTMTYLTGRAENCVRLTMHNLGDKGLLTLPRRDGTELNWIIGPVLQQALEKMKIEET